MTLENCEAVWMQHTCNQSLQRSLRLEEASAHRVPGYSMPNFHFCRLQEVCRPVLGALGCMKPL